MIQCRKAINAAALHSRCRYKKTGFRFWAEACFCVLGDEVAVDIVEEQRQYHAHEADLRSK